jgi:hypothetical protein
MYLGAKLKKKTFEDGTTAWGLSPAKYVQHAVRNVKAYLKNNLDGQYSLPKRRDNPFPVNYAPEEDVTPMLEPAVATYYMQLICNGCVSSGGSTSALRSPCCPRTP